MSRMLTGVDASRKNRRRILRKIAENDVTALGDPSTVDDAEAFDDLIANRGARR